MVIRRLVYELTHPLLNALARNHWLIHRLFGIRIPKGTIVHFDPTTLLLRHALLRSVDSADRNALEIGIGQGALLSLSLCQSTALRVDGVDLSLSRVASSQAVAAHNQIPAHFFVSDLFADIPRGQRYDLIFFNPPYVPTSAGQQLRLTRRMRADSDRVWDGGQDGVEVLREFLRQAPRFLSPRGRILFGVQAIFISQERVRSLVEESGFELFDRISRCCIPSTAYLLRRRGGAESGIAT